MDTSNLPIASTDLLLLGLFVLVVGACAGLLFGIRSLVHMRAAPLARRIRAAGGGTGALAGSSASLQPGAPPSLLDHALRPIAAVATPSDQEELEGVRARLSHAGYRREQAVLWFATAKVVLCLTGAGLASYLNARHLESFDRQALYTIVAMMIGFYAPSVWLAGRIKERKALLTHGLPDALDLLVTCVEAGLGLDLAVNRVAAEIKLATPELSAELTQTALEMRAGLTRSESARRLARRTGVDELKYLASVLVQTELFGTSIAKSLRVMSEAMRVRRMQNAEQRAATVAVKMTLPLVVCILPSLFLIVLGPAIINIIRTMLPALGGSP